MLSLSSPVLRVVLRLLIGMALLNEFVRCAMRSLEVQTEWEDLCETMMRTQQRLHHITGGFWRHILICLPKRERDCSSNNGQFITTRQQEKWN